MARSRLMTSAIGAAFMAAVCAAVPANALEPKQCGARTEMVAALQNEGQVQIITAERQAIGSPKDIFTTNPTLSLGYNLEAGTGAEAGSVCVRAKYTDIRLNADAQLARPAWASFGRGTAHDAHLAKIEAQDNDKVLMGATALVPAADGSEQAGPFIMVTRGNPAPGTHFKSAGQATATSRDGDVGTFLKMTNVEPTDNFRTLAGRKVLTASADQASYRPR